MAKLQAAENIRRFAEQYKALVEAADLLDGIGSLELAAAEAKSAAETAKKELEEIKAETAKAKAAQKKVVDAVQAEFEEQRAVAQKMLDDTKIHAEELKKASEQAAQSIINAANDQADKVKAEALQISNSAGEMQTNARNEVALLQVEIEQKAAELKAVEDQLAKLKARIASFIG